MMNATLLPGLIILFVTIIGREVIDYFRRRRNDDERVRVITIPRILLTEGILTLGLFILIIGGVVNVRIIEYSGAGVMLLGGIVNAIYMWQDSKWLGLVILFLVVLSQYFLFF